MCVYVECIWDIYACGLVYMCVWCGMSVCTYVCVYGMCVYVVGFVYMGSVCGMYVMWYICVCDVCTCAFIRACVSKDLHKLSRCAAQLLCFLDSPWCWN